MTINYTVLVLAILIGGAIAFAVNRYIKKEEEEFGDHQNNES